MGKILSLVIFVAALVWSWNLIHSATPVDFETHSGIQQKLADLILENLKTKKPQAEQAEITRLWTEALSDNKVRAVFAYRFVEKSEAGENVDQLIEGEAVLHREPSDDAQVDKWVLQQVQTTGDNVNFSEGTIVTPVPGVDEDNADPTAPPSSGGG